MRVGANVRQYHRIKKMHADGVPAEIIANSIPMTPQSLEKILAHMDGREEVILAVEENAEVQELRLRNAELAAKLAKFEEPTDDGTQKDDTQGDDTPASEIEADEEIEAGEKVEA